MTSSHAHGARAGTKTAHALSPQTRPTENDRSSIYFDEGVNGGYPPGGQRTLSQSRKVLSATQPLLHFLGPSVNGFLTDSGGPSTASSGSLYYLQFLPHLAEKKIVWRPWRFS